MTKQAKGTYHLVSLGCPKNLVDSESMSRLLNQRGLVASSIPQKSEYLIVCIQIIYCLERTNMIGLFYSK